jgi:kynurenine formamidase
MTVDGGDARTLAQFGGQWQANGTARQLGGFFTDGLLRFNDDMIIMPLQAATQWDAYSHVYYEDQLYNGFPAESVTSQGAFHCGIDKVDVNGVVSRGVLLDVVRFRGAGDYLADGQPVTPEELDEVARVQRVEITSGDIVLVHTGWWERFIETGDGTVSAAGLDWRCAQWLHEREAAAVAADNLMVEDPVSAVEGTFMPFHLLCLRDMGLMLGEYWDLTALSADCAADGVYEFQLVAPPLRVIGAVGSPLNPIALK